MKITLDKAIELLTQAAAIILPDEEGTPLMYPSVNADEDDFLSMSWTDEEGYEYTIDCLRGKETEVEIEDNCLIFKTDEGETVKVQLLMPISIEVTGTTTMINLMQ
jgi:hypothetical protein